MDIAETKYLPRRVTACAGWILLVIIVAVSAALPVSAYGPSSVRDTSSLPSQARPGFEEILSKSKDMSLNEIRQKGRGMLLEGKDPQTALLWYHAALNRNEEDMNIEELECLARIYSNMGHIYFYEYRNPQKAYPYLMRSSDLCDKYGDEAGFALTDIYYTFADIYTSYNDIPKASYYLKKGFNVSLNKDLNKLGYSFANLAWFSILNDSVGSITKERKQFREAEPADTSVLVTYCRHILDAIDCIDRDNYAAAAMKADSALVDQTFVTLENPDMTILRYRAATLLISAHLYTRGHRMDMAARRLREAENIVCANKLFDLYDFLYSEKAAYCRLSGNEELARQCEIQAMSVRDSLYNSREYGQIRNMEEDWKMSEIKGHLQERDKERRTLVMQRDKQRSVILTMGISAAAIVFLLLWIVRKNRALKEANASLFRKNIELVESLSFSKRNRENPVRLTKVVDSENVCKGAAGDDDVREAPRQANVKSGDGEPVSGGCPEDAAAFDEVDENDDLREVFDTVQHILSESQEVYNPDFNIETLSHISGIHSRRISQAINSVSRKSFSTLVGEYRINEACRRLLEPGVRPTIGAVADSVGYRSRTHFSRVFKAVTGMTTTEFIRQARMSQGDNV